MPLKSKQPLGGGRPKSLFEIYSAGRTPDMTQASDLPKGQLEELAAKGQGSDTEVAHVTPGEMVVPPQAQTPAVQQSMMQAGYDPAKYTVGSPLSRVNDQTGMPMFNPIEEITVRGPTNPSDQFWNPDAFVLSQGGSYGLGPGFGDFGGGGGAPAPNQDDSSTATTNQGQEFNGTVDADGNYQVTTRDGRTLTIDRGTIDQMHQEFGENNEGFLNALGRHVAGLFGVNIPITGGAASGGTQYGEATFNPVQLLVNILGPVGAGWLSEQVIGAPIDTVLGTDVGTGYTPPNGDPNGSATIGDQGNGNFLTNVFDGIQGALNYELPGTGFLDTEIPNPFSGGGFQWPTFNGSGSAGGGQGVPPNNDVIITNGIGPGGVDLTTYTTSPGNSGDLNVGGGGATPGGSGAGGAGTVGSGGGGASNTGNAPPSGTPPNTPGAGGGSGPIIDPNTGLPIGYTPPPTDPPTPDYPQANTDPFSNPHYNRAIDSIDAYRRRRFGATPALGHLKDEPEAAPADGAA